MLVELRMEMTVDRLRSFLRYEVLKASGFLLRPTIASLLLHSSESTNDVSAIDGA